MNLFQNVEYLKPSAYKSRSRANLFDMFVTVLVVIIASNLESMGFAFRAGVVVLYVLVFNPLSLCVFGGTIGHLITNQRVRKIDDYSKRISVAQAYSRFALLLVNQFVGILTLGRKDKLVFEKVSKTQTVELDLEKGGEVAGLLVKHIAYRKFALYGAIYLAWVIWLGNYWFLPGLGVVFDMYVSKKVNWSPWKRRNGKNHIVVEWVDALIFAVVAVTIINIFLFQNYKIPTGSMEKSLQIGDHLYVSKVAYGPRIPETPLALPFMQHTIPGTVKKSYVEWPKWDYKRLKGFGKVERWDPVVFNFPAGDTVCIDEQYRSYDAIVRDRLYGLMHQDQVSKKPLKTWDEYYGIARNAIRKEREIIVRPTDKKDNYIKRCVGVAGDSLQIIDGVVYVNGQKEPEIPGKQYMCYVNTEGNVLSKKNLTKLGIYKDDIQPVQNGLLIPMTQEMKSKIEGFRNVKGVTQYISDNDFAGYNVFPFNNSRDWTQDNFGPIYIPKAGATVDLDLDILPQYKRIIGTYEKNDLQVKDSTIYINGEAATSYTFKMDYYWMMGDNRHSSLDSRFWGYVPEDHIIGKPKFIWLSKHKDKSFPANIQLKRMFRKIK